MVLDNLGLTHRKAFSCLAGNGIAGGLIMVSELGLVRHGSC